MGRRGIGELEAAVMDVLWNRTEPASVRDVLAALGDESLAYTTVMTVLDRLARKGTVVRERHGRAWLYRPAATREAHIAQLMREALALAEDRESVLAHFARLVSKDEAAALRQALDRPRRTP